MVFGDETKISVTENFASHGNCNYEGSCKKAFNLTKTCHVFSCDVGSGDLFRDLDSKTNQQIKICNNISKVNNLLNKTTRGMKCQFQTMSLNLRINRKLKMIINLAAISQVIRKKFINLQN